MIIALVPSFVPFQNVLTTSNTDGSELMRVKVSVDKTKGEIKWSCPTTNFVVTLEKKGPGEAVLSFEGDAFQSQLALRRVSPGVVEAELNCSEEKCDGIVARAEMGEGEVSLFVTKDGATKLAINLRWDRDSSVRTASAGAELRVCERWIRAEIKLLDGPKKGSVKVESYHPSLKRVETDWSYEVDATSSERTEEMSFTADYNGGERRLEWESNRSYGPDRWEGRTVTKAVNVPWIGFREQVDTFLYEFGGAGPLPSHIELRTDRDGKLFSKITLDLEKKEDGFTASGSVAGIPKPGNEFDAKIEVKTDYRSFATFEIM